MEIKPLNVTQLTKYIKRLLSSDPILHNIKVEGEISNFKKHYSGHLYFTLKDENSKLKCIMFSNNCGKLSFEPEDGMNVVVTGYIQLYERDGNYQLCVKTIEPKGIGDLYIAYENLKKKLEAEGLFDTNHKKNIPFIPKKIGVVTSLTGAAIRDIITVVHRRYPAADIIIYPVHVQGETAHTEICRGIAYLDDRSDIDLIITGRGGGSIEELWAFNEEDVARTIFNARTPIISAVGHETDYTIADFVADLRAPTPSVAGELSVPNLDELNYKLDEMLLKLRKSYQKLLRSKLTQLEKIKTTIKFNSPIKNLNRRMQYLDNLLISLNKSFSILYEKKKNNLKNLGSKLHVLSPLSVLDRGYSIILKENGHVVNSIRKVNQNEILKILLKDGELKVMTIDNKKH